MEILLDIVFWSVISVFLTAFIMIYFLLKAKRSLLFYSFQLFITMILIFSISIVLGAIEKSLNFKYIFFLIEISSMSYLAVSWLFFVLVFTGNKIIHSKKFVFLLFFFPFILSVFLVTNNYHHLFFTSYNFDYFLRPALIGWVYTIESYTLVIITAIVLIKYSIKQMGDKRKQTIILILAAILTLFVEMINSVLFKLYGFTFSCGAFHISVSALLVSFATFKYRFLNIVPIALRKIVDNMNEAIIVIDNANKVMDVNDSFKSTFKEVAQININDDISYFTQCLKNKIENTNEVSIIDAIERGASDNMSVELCLIAPCRKYFSVNLQPVKTKKGEILGRVISFSDVSQYKNLLYELDEKNTDLTSLNEELTAMNEELIAANEQLKDYSETIEELAITKERNRFARDVHDTLGHSMTVLIALLEVCSVTCKTDPNLTEEKLQDAINVARDGMKELRRSISGLAPEKLETNNLIHAINNLVKEFETSGVHVDLTIEGIEHYERNFMISDAVYRLCQEALTNALRHGQAKNAIIILRFSKEWIKIYIFDDGKGCKDIKMGYGLKGMEQRIMDLNGRIRYGSDGEKGFNIQVEIPVKK